MASKKKNAASTIENNPAGGGMKKAKQMLEDRLEYETMKDMVNSMGSNNQNAGSNSQSQSPGTPANPEVLSQHTEWLSTLPEDQRQVGMQLLSMMHSQGNSQMNPMMAMMMPQMMQMMQNNGNNNNDEAIKGLYAVLTELVKNQNGGGDNAAELINAINNAKSNEENILNTLLSGLIQSNNNNNSDVDDKLDFLYKAKEAGLITDPQSMMEVKKMESERDREKYRIDKDYEIEKMKIDKDREQTEKAGEFLSDIADTIQNLNEGEEAESNKNELPPQQNELNYACPSCSSTITVSPQTEDGSKIQCSNCGKSIRVRRKQKQKQEA